MTFLISFLTIKMGDEWEYKQRWEMQKVFPSIYISSFLPAKTFDTLIINSIKSILVIRDPKETFVKTCVSFTIRIFGN